MLSLVEAVVRQYIDGGDSKSHITGKYNSIDKKTASLPLQNIFK